MTEECGECGASFSAPAELLDHVRSAHGATGPNGDVVATEPTAIHTLRCGLCGQRFDSREALARHNLTPHPPGTPGRPRRSDAPARPAA